MANLTLCLNLGVSAPTQFTNYDFKSFANFGGRVIAAGENGIFAVDESSLDDSTAINAWFELPNSDLGYGSLKRLLHAVLECEADGDISIVVTSDGSVVNTYTVGKILRNIVSRSIPVYLSGTPIGVRFTFYISNIAGSDFAIDKLIAFTNILSRRHISRDSGGAIMLKISTLDITVVGNE